VVDVPTEVRLPVGLVGRPTAAALATLTDNLAVDLISLDVADDARLRTLRVLLVWDFRWHSIDTALARTSAVEWIHTASAGVNHLLDRLPSGTRLMVTNSAGIFDHAIAEYVLGLVMAHAKGLLETAAAQRERRWAYRETRDVAGQTMTIVGLGHIGRAVAELALGVGMRVVGVRTRAGSVPGVEVVTPDRLTDVLAKSDYVVATVALTDATRALIGRSELASMRPTAYLINVARGAVVDLPALIDALEAGQIAGAALDVFEEEPLPSESPLWTTRGLLVSPHMAGDSYGWDARVVDLFIDNVRRYQRCEPLRNLVDLDRGY
jgi:phosphoglycerate dehydrogenase-like enzyme